MQGGSCSATLYTPHLLLITVLACFIFCLNVNAQDLSDPLQTVDAWVSLTSPAFTYTPFLCNSTDVLVDPSGCLNAW